MTANTQAATQAGGTDLDPAKTLSAICDMFGIGVLARSESTILENVRNTLRREHCLRAIEYGFFMEPAERDEDFPDEDPGEECMLSWGADPDQYVVQFREALARRASPQPVAPEQQVAKFQEYMASCAPIKNPAPLDVWLAAMRAALAPQPVAVDEQALLSDLAYMAAYSTDDMQDYSKDRLLAWASSMINRAAMATEKFKRLIRQHPSAAPSGEQKGMARDDFIERIVLGVAEIDGRDSPKDQPEMMLVTDAELRAIVIGTFEQADEEGGLQGAAPSAQIADASSQKERGGA